MKYNASKYTLQYCTPRNLINPAHYPPYDAHLRLETNRKPTHGPNNRAVKFTEPEL